MTTVPVLVAGESLVDIVRAADGATAEHVGGSPANVALTLARLGTPVALLTSTGDDERGSRVREHLSGGGIHLLPEGPAMERTSTAAATLGTDGQATYEFDLINRYDTAALAELDLTALTCFHTGSIAATLAPGGQQILELATSLRDRATISYDPNARPAIMGSTEQALQPIERLVDLADVVKLSDEDAAWLVGKGTDEADPAELAARWLDRGPAIVVVTLGPDGAHAVCRAGVVKVPGATVHVADTVGAGDSFSGALIDALARKGLLGAAQRTALQAISQDDLREVLEFAVAVAAVTVSRPGADPPRRAEIGRTASPHERTQ